MNVQDNELHAAFAAWTATHRELLATEYDCMRCPSACRCGKDQACCRRRDAIRERAERQLSVAMELLRSQR